MNDIFYSDKIFTIEELKKDLYNVNYPLSINNKTSMQYYCVPCGFDIETTSFYEKNEKRAIMYEWTFGIDGRIVIGRTWEEFIDLIEFLINKFQLNGKTRLLVGIHNLAFEFQFIRKWFKWDKVFSVDKRKPIYAITNGIEFRCTYQLTGLSLEKVAEDILFKWNIKKDVGDLDYKKIRNSKTKLTDKEIKYCVDDVKIVMALMEEKANQDGGYHKIPLTKTGYVRNRCRNKCFGEEKDHVIKGKREKYTRAIQTLKLNEDDYVDLKYAFQGGFTHANSWRVKDINKNVASYDFTSSYPAVLLTEKYPVSKPVLWSDKMLERLKDYEYFKKTLNDYCCLITIRFTNLKEKFIYEHYLSRAKCKIYSFDKSDYRIDNGRVIFAKILETTITEQDFLIIEKCYSWDSIDIIKMKTFIKGYLPTDFIKTIIELYKSKTKLKGIIEQVIEYMAAKSDLNALYGMCVMDIVRDENLYDDDWVPEKSKDVQYILDKYNFNKGRFLYYPWGVWCTAYARRNLFSGILEFGEDYIYSDTDSIKVLNAKDHLDYFIDYRTKLEEKIKIVSEYHGIPIEDFSPQTIKGVEKLIGVWEYEGTYGMFKTLGAKRYMYTTLNKKTYNEEINITVSGLNKKVVVPYLNKMFNVKKSRTYGGRMKKIEKIFDFFNEGMYIPAGKTGKMTHTYIDDEVSGYVTDYQGNKAYYHEKSSIHLEDSDYKLSISEEYAEVLLDILKIKVRED